MYFIDNLLKKFISHSRENGNPALFMGMDPRVKHEDDEPCHPEQLPRHPELNSGSNKRDAKTSSA
jgi:hypothetical protein